MEFVHAWQSMDVSAVLRRLPHSLQRCPEVAFALRAHLAVSTGDCAAFLRAHCQAGWVQQALMLPKLQQVGALGRHAYVSAFQGKPMRDLTLTLFVSWLLKWVLVLFPVQQSPSRTFIH